MRGGAVGVSFVAFVIAADPDHAELWRIRLGAVLMACAIVGTRYIADSTASYSPPLHGSVEHPLYIALAVVLALLVTQLVWAFFFQIQVRRQPPARLRTAQRRRHAVSFMAEFCGSAVAAAAAVHCGPRRISAVLSAPLRAVCEG